MLKTVQLLGLAAAAFARTQGYTFDMFLSEFGKSYPEHELAQRKALFELSLEQVLAHNAEDHSWKMTINQFSDLTDAEIKAFKGHSGTQQMSFSAPPPGFFDNLKSVSELPKSVDWREKGVVTPAKDQQSCGSCWAFSATEVLESHVAIATGKLLELGPQQMVSCAPNPDECGGTGGCQGSVQWLGFNYTIGAGGLSLEKDYPYTGRTGKCNPDETKPAAGITGYVRLPSNNYTALMNAVATLGPVAISVDASWTLYSSGVFSGDCGTTIDHAVVLVGYGTDPEGGDYYLVRNSWGTGWGEDGYIRIARNDNDSENCGIDEDPASGVTCKPYPKTQKVCGKCGILSESSYPTGAFLV